MTFYTFGMRPTTRDSQPPFRAPRQHTDLVDALTQALDYKHAPFLWTDEVLENYGNLLFGLALSRVRF
jgi:hypothetical protein